MSKELDVLDSVDGTGKTLIIIQFDFAPEEGPRDRLHLIRTTCSSHCTKSPSIYLQDTESSTPFPLSSGKNSERATDGCGVGA